MRRRPPKDFIVFKTRISYRFFEEKPGSQRKFIEFSSTFKKRESQNIRFLFINKKIF